MTLIINTLDFLKDLQNGTSQADLVDRIAKLGANGIEVRREYFKHFPNELKAVGKQAKKDHLIVRYSVPDEVFTNSGEVNPKLPTYFKEGELMGIDEIKFNTGHFDRFTGDLSKAFNNLPLNKIQMNVENDQTKVSGPAQAVKNFVSSARRAGYKSIGCVFDLGNWAFTHGNALKSAQLLAPYVHYIHLKNVINQNGNLSTSKDLNTGIFNWKDIISHLPKVPYALEYPMDSDKQMANQIKLVRMGAGA